MLPHHATCMPIPCHTLQEFHGTTRHQGKHYVLEVGSLMLKDQDGGGDSQWCRHSMCDLNLRILGGPPYPPWPCREPCLTVLADFLRTGEQPARLHGACALRGALPRGAAQRCLCSACQPK